MAAMDVVTEAERVSERAAADGSWLALDVCGATVSYDRDGPPALAEVNLRLPHRAITALVGPNGAGKSTLLKAVAGLLPLRAGQVAVYGKPLRAVRRRVA